ncbi:hypothetical protein FHG64_08460 [Antarcticibacterium flavum]|uniref:Uncharacterized protein n=1 Tax=Antarcticibacterium flavum TaxID=2058175 RepID=A0A5B7X3Y2_9FLAO|nr:MULTISPECIES: hypothetical protein [Antarcticibacterium]QCY69421.1 hypothetical protein FHG64_08460 [Antarcticibacterium flavum]
MHSITLRQMALLFVTGLLTCSIAQAQIQKPDRPIEDFEFRKNTALVYSVDPKTNGINEVFLKEPNVEHQLYKLKEDCYRCEYYLGSVEGTLKIKDSKIVNSRSSVFTINTMENLMPGTDFLPGPEYAPGSRFSLAGIKTTVLANQKGSFVLKAN